jgi:hypothetical protein
MDATLLANAAFTALIAASALVFTATVPLVAMYEAEELEYFKAMFSKVAAELNVGASAEAALKVLPDKLRDHGIAFCARFRPVDYVLRVRVLLYGLILAAAIIAVTAISLKYLAIFGTVKEMVDDTVRLLLFISILITIFVVLFALFGVQLQVETRRMTRELLLLDYGKDSTTNSAEKDK